MMSLCRSPFDPDFVNLITLDYQLLAISDPLHLFKWVHHGNMSNDFLIRVDRHQTYSSSDAARQSVEMPLVLFPELFSLRDLEALYHHEPIMDVIPVPLSSVFLAAVLTMSGISRGGRPSMLEVYF
jgi:hypothetical protein